MKIGFVLGLCVLGQLAQAMTLDEYLDIVKKKNRLLNSIEASTQASESKREAGDIVLAPQLNLSALKMNDKSLPSSLASDDRQVIEYSLGVAKKFSTGTALSFSAKTDAFDNTGAYTAALSKYSTGSLGINLQQSLWKDFFGAGTRLRLERERLVNSAETMGLELKKRGLLVEAEASFWDYAVATEDLKLKKENLERARKLEKWTTNRVSNGISDRSDLMNVKALTSLRELELQTAESELKSKEVSLREKLDLTEAEPTPEIKANLIEARPYVKELSSKKNVVQIEAYLSSLEAKTKQAVSEEVKDSLKPDLSLVGYYNTTSYDADYNQMLQNISKTDHPKSYIGLNFTWLFDTDAKKAQLSSAEKDAYAASLTAQKKQIESKNAWQEHLRKYQVVSETVKTLEKIAGFQRERAKAEQDKFTKGRTITANVVTAETESAEAEVNYLKGKSGLRKLEAATLLFAEIQE